MGTASQSGKDKDTHGDETAPSAVLVHEQLKRLVAHSLFTNSKRYPVLLTYVVEQMLLGNAGELKERLIGVEAFGREPEYDVNLDPVVRTTAAEVRKRLSQYYYNPDHAGELVIELPVGSYVPSFRWPISSRTSPSVESSIAGQAEIPSSDSAVPSLPPAGAKPASSLFWRLPTALAFRLSLLTCKAGRRRRFPPERTAA